MKIVIGLILSVVIVLAIIKGLIMPLIVGVAIVLPIIEGLIWLSIGIRLMMAEFDDNCNYIKCYSLLGTWEFAVDGHMPE